MHAKSSSSSIGKQQTQIILLPKCVHTLNCETERFEYLILRPSPSTSIPHHQYSTTIFLFLSFFSLRSTHLVCVLCVFSVISHLKMAQFTQFFIFFPGQRTIKYPASQNHCYSFGLLASPGTNADSSATKRRNMRKPVLNE